VTLRVLLILGHPRAEGLGGALFEAYASGAQEAGSELRTLRVGDLAFDPDVNVPSPADQPLEPDLAEAQSLLEWCQHLVLVYPTWWGTCPARLKGLFDRLLAPGFAFRYFDDGHYQPRLTGRTAELITTMDTPPWVYRWIYCAPGHRALGQATLGFCGIRVVRRTVFGPVIQSDAAERARWLARSRELGARLRNGPESAAQRVSRRMLAWLAALRLQFYPMTWIAYSVGALTAPGALDRRTYWLGLAALFLLEAATVFGNDYWDYESDRQNDHWGPFNGGSRVLIDGRLERARLGAAARWLFGGFVVLALGLTTIGPAGANPTAGLAFSLLAVAAFGYTAPPLKLSYRTLGELDVALTHSLGVLLIGYVLQRGAWHDPLPWLLSVPLGVAVLPAITLSGIPDYTADRAAGKRTLAVRYGVAGALRFASATAFAAGVSGVAWWLLGWDGGLYGSAISLAALHAAWLARRVHRYRRECRPPGRIDGLMVLALSLILWFGVLPLLAVT
jgi:1,4-dihydroxy-2-naphthoate octaprenyltransferase